MKKLLLLVLVLALSAALCSAVAEGSLLDAVYGSLDADTGAHLNYTVFASAFGGVESNYDVHAKGISHYTVKTSQAFGRTVIDISCFIDGTAYILDTDKKEAQAVTTVAPSLLKYLTFLGQDELGKLLSKWYQTSGFQAENREVDGIAYTVEVYPTDNGTENAFYFDDSGRLVYVHDDSIQIVGDRFITINTIDSEVDESLLDLSAYTVIEK